MGESIALSVNREALFLTALLNTNSSSILLYLDSIREVKKQKKNPALL